MGTFAVISLMVYSTISQVELEYQPNAELTNSALFENSTGLDYSFDLIKLNSSALNTLERDSQNLKIKIATSLAFWCGCIQVNISFNLG